VVLHFRGCSGEPNRQVASYSAGHTGDLDYVSRLLRRREPLTPIACVGYSLGASVLLKWLGERGTDAPIQAAVAVSVPFRLELTVQRLDRGFSRLYQNYLLRQLRRHYRRKIQWQHQFPLPFRALLKLRNFYEFDNFVTAPLHGYADADDYYRRASCRPYLKQIRVDTLILHALDDPFMVPAGVPQAAELADSITLELSPGGGHVGFVTGPFPWRAGYWLEQRIPLFLAERFTPAGTTPGQAARLGSPAGTATDRATRL
jgi:predicted alpha/beta-fold hydrolase